MPSASGSATRITTSFTVRRVLSSVTVHSMVEPVASKRRSTRRTRKMRGQLEAAYLACLHQTVASARSIHPRATHSCSTTFTIAYRARLDQGLPTSSPTAYSPVMETVQGPTGSLAVALRQGTLTDRAWVQEQDRRLVWPGYRTKPKRISAEVKPSLYTCQGSRPVVLLSRSLTCPLSLPSAPGLPKLIDHLEEVNRETGLSLEFLVTRPCPLSWASSNSRDRNLAEREA